MSKLAPGARPSTGGVAPLPSGAIIAALALWRDRSCWEPEGGRGAKALAGALPKAWKGGAMWGPAQPVACWE